MGADQVSEKTWNCKGCTYLVLMQDEQGNVATYCSIYVKKKRLPKRKWKGNEIMCLDKKEEKQWE